MECRKLRLLITPDQLMLVDWNPKSKHPAWLIPTTTPINNWYPSDNAVIFLLVIFSLKYNVNTQPPCHAKYAVLYPAAPSRWLHQPANGI